MRLKSFSIFSESLYVITLKQIRTTLLEGDYVKAQLLTSSSVNALPTLFLQNSLVPLTIPFGVFVGKLFDSVKRHNTISPGVKILRTAHTARIIPAPESNRIAPRARLHSRGACGGGV